MSPRRFATNLGFAAVLISSLAGAQQPPPPNQGMPAGHPPVLMGRDQAGAQPGMPQGMPAPVPAPGLPPGRPMGPGGQQLPPGRGQQVPGRQLPVRPIPQPGMGGRALPAPAPAPAPKPEHCPGHGPMDAPHHVNWWQGILAVDNEASQKGGINSLLFRYNNKTDPCDPKNQPPPFLASMLNFGILAATLFVFGRKPLKEALVKRRQVIMQDIDTASRLKQEAERRLGDYEDKLEHLDERLETLKADYIAQAEAERKNLLVELEERRARMQRDAAFRIEQELKEARAQLLAEAVRGAVAAAEELIQAQVSSTDQQRLAEDYLSTFAGSLGTADGQAKNSQSKAGATQ
ncbi:hypothetical protein [Chondromyces crocatus]|uniref:ATP synthase subunit b n=1 Tax=Chondromyces crocatus TaxID=52 RepID=A0A0K1EU91_CHOCO|nr:hypothetical protein [Chondromyces crocatus]AKT44222.1 ATP synthase subunit B [Chondromyces crocatus]